MAEERRAVPLGKRPLDLFLASFLLMNIPVVLLIESQVLLPASFFPQPLLDAVQWYVHFSGDYLVGDKPAFLQGLVFAEVLFQLPLLIANSYAFIAGKDWGRITGVIYAAHVATTMFPIFADILVTNVPTRNMLIGIYIPYLIIPLIMLARLAPAQYPFTESVSLSKVKKEE